MSEHPSREILFSDEIPVVDEVLGARAEVMEARCLASYIETRISLSGLALAFPKSIGGRSYSIEIGRPRQSVGFFKSNVIYGWRADSSYYGVLVLADNSSVELSQADGSASVWRDGVKIGTITYSPASKAEGKFARGSWQLDCDGTRFGVVKPQAIVTTTNLAIQRDSGLSLPLRLGRAARITEFFATIWRLLSLGFLYTPPPPSDDYVIDQESCGELSESETAFYFGAVLFFRAMVFGLDEGAE